MMYGFKFFVLIMGSLVPVEQVKSLRSPKKLQMLLWKNLLLSYLMNNLVKKKCSFGLSSCKKIGNSCAGDCGSSYFHLMYLRILLTKIIV